MGKQIPGYVVMTARAIREGAKLHIEKRTLERENWDNVLRIELIVWRTGMSLWRRMWWGWPPDDTDKLVSWYWDRRWYSRPLRDDTSRPEVHPDMLQWAKDMKHMADEESVFINVDDAAALLSWLKKPESTNNARN